MSTMATVAQISAVGTFLPRGSSLPSPKGDRLDLDPAAAAMKAARANLSAGMGVGNLDKEGAPIGGSFAARFSAAIKDLASGEKKAVADVSDAWTRFVDQTEKADAAMVANTRTIGLTAQAHEQLKIQLQGEAILQREGVKDTEARRAALAALAKQAGEAAMALERAKISDKIKFDRGTAFLTPEDVQVASQLKGIYGNDIPAALASSEAAQLRFNDTLKKVNDIGGTFASGFFTDLAHGVTAITALQNAMTRLSDVLIDMAARKLMANALGGATGGFNLSSFFGGGAEASSADFGKAALGASAMGNVFDRGQIIHPYALGGIMSDILVRPTLFPMANGAGLAGEAGPEAIMPLSRGADGRLGVRSPDGGGAPKFTVNVINNAGAEVSVGEPKPDGNGGFSLDAMIDKAVASNMAKPGTQTSNTMRNGFGLGQQLVKR